MRFVVKDIDTGHYLKGESAWFRSRHPDINRAKIFHRQSDAANAVNKFGSRAYRYTVVPVVVSEAA